MQYLSTKKLLLSQNIFCDMQKSFIMQWTLYRSCLEERTTFLGTKHALYSKQQLRDCRSMRKHGPKFPY